MTVQELITGALTDLGSLGQGETPATEELNHGLSALNQLIASWSAQALPIPQLTRHQVNLTGAPSYTLSGLDRPIKIRSAAVIATSTVDLPLEIADAQRWAAYADKSGTADFGEVLFYEDGLPLGKIHIAPRASGTLQLLSEKPVGTGLAQVRDTLQLTGAASYTIGAGGQMNTERPARVLAASIAAGSSVSKGVRLVTAEEWAAYPRKGSGGTFAEIGLYDNGYPAATLYLAPKPASGGQLELWMYKPLSSFASLATAISLPPGYERALRLALAGELAPSHGRVLDETLAANIADAKTSVFGLNQAILGHPAGPPPAVPVPVPVSEAPPAE